MSGEFKILVLDKSAMKLSKTRILTTHTGSLPRPEGLVAMLGSVARGEPVDEAALAEAARSSDWRRIAGPGRTRASMSSTAASSPASASQPT